MYLINRILYVVVFFFPFLALAEAKQNTVCLNMIVKNESEVIKRCLTSVLPIIDYWVIVDTGSTDGTQEIIKNFMKTNGIPGELHERPWVDFSHNRNEALSLAQNKGDYVLFIDADEYLVYDDDFKLPTLNKDYFYINISHSGSIYGRIHLINNHLDWKWVGVLHEVLNPPASRSYATLEKVVNMYTTEGARSKDPMKYQKDAEVLEAALKDDPNNTRYVFYLAQSYRDAGLYSQALQNYEKRLEMGGWDQELFWSKLQIGYLKEMLNMPAESIIESYLQAFQYRKTRIEPLYHIAHLFRQNGDYKSGYLSAKIAQTIPVSQDVLFLQQWMYDYGIQLELSICAYWIEKYEECQQLSLDLLKKTNLPPAVRTCVQNNLGFANAKLLEQICESAKKSK